MKSVQPSADLPPASAHIMLTYNSLPARQQRTMPRNMTGVYLGSEVPPNSPRTYHSVPPLAKPRGTLFRPRTPIEKRRRAYTDPGQAGLEQGLQPKLQQVSAKQVLLTDPDCVSASLLYIYKHPCPTPMALPYTPPMILRLPILRPKQQQQRVEALRIREEPRGFQPQPIRKAKPPKSRQDEAQLQLNPNNNPSPVLRKSVRNFVAATNSGVTHLEDLGLEELSLRSLSTGRESSLAPSIIEDIQNANKKLVGLEECYRKVCKGNLSSLQSLLPARKSGGPSSLRTKTVATPLTIRSFRNPRSPHSVVQYSDLRSRSTLAGSAKPRVPAPYYYNSKCLAKTSDDGGSKVRLTRLPAPTQSTERVLAAPGVGVISQSSLSRRAASLPSDPPPGIEGIPPPTRGSNAKFADSEDIYSQQTGFRVPSGTPATSTSDLCKINSSSSGVGGTTTFSSKDSTTSKIHPSTPPTSPARSRKSNLTENENNSHSIPTGELKNESTRQELCGDKSEKSSESSSLSQGERMLPLSIAIVVSVEDDHGESRVVDLEEEVLEAELEGVGKNPAQQSESDQLMQEWKEASEKKQAELQKLLEEHQEIISHIEELEKIKENDTNAPSEESQ
ncbi:uncharacterized protein [Asterias amurensis]|uniref:uncharacterized protein isoform X2 n=1 Tax=Asterias amurensis TaxID=7602 RepID=UPI003AB1458B